MARSLLVAFLTSLGVLGCGTDDASSGEGGGGRGSAGGGNDAEAAFPAPVPDDCFTDVSPGLHEVECDGLDYRVNVPAACHDRACGVILDVHGKDMTGHQQNQNTGLAELGAESDYLVVQPTANLGPPLFGTELKPTWDVAGDPPKVHAVLERVIVAFHADRKRLHVTGFSQGGFMTMTLLCRFPETWASIAPAGALVSPCGDATPEVDILYMHGRNDGLAPFAAASASIDRMKEALGLDQTDEVSRSDDHDWVRHTGAADVVFEVIEHDYATNPPLLGHCFPNAPEFNALACKGDTAFTWGQAVRDFFVAHPRP